MKAILKFDLPEEREEFETAQKGWKYLNVLDNFDNFLRNKLKYGNLDDVQHHIYEQVRAKLWEIRSEE